MSLKSVTRKVARCLATGTAGWHLLNGEVDRENLRQRLCEERLIRLTAEWGSAMQQPDGWRVELCRTVEGLTSFHTQSMLEMRETAG